MSEEQNDIQELAWSASVPMFGHPLLLKQLGIVFGIPFGSLAVFIGVSSGKSVYTLYALGFIGTFLLLTFLLTTLVYGGRHKADFVLSEKKAFYKSELNQTKKSRIINNLTVFLGLFSNMPTVAGAGMLAQSRQEVSIPWKSVKKVKYMPKHYTILLKGSLMQSIALFCTEDNYNEVKQFVAQRTGHLEKN